LILCVVAPVDHNQVVPELEVSVTLPPAQKVVGPPTVIVGAKGKVFTVTTVGADDGLWHPFAFVTCTV
jgi:hypothetical protein